MSDKPKARQAIGNAIIVFSAALITCHLVAATLEFMTFNFALSELDKLGANVEAIHAYYFYLGFHAVSLFLHVTVIIAFALVAIAGRLLQMHSESA